jgi:hypothetical protein
MNVGRSTLCVMKRMRLEECLHDHEVSRMLGQKDKKHASDWYKHYRQDDENLRLIEDKLMKHQIRERSVSDDDEDELEDSHSYEKEDARVDVLMGASPYSPISGMTKEQHEKDDVYEARKKARQEASGPDPIHLQRQWARAEAKANRMDKLDKAAAERKAQSKPGYRDAALIIRKQKGE